MAKKEHLQFWHKKQGKAAGVSAMARHAGMSQVRSAGDAVGLTRAQAFMQQLKQEIRKAV